MWLGLRVDGRLCAALHSSNEPSELSRLPLVIVMTAQHYKYRPWIIIFGPPAQSRGREN